MGKDIQVKGIYKKYSYGTQNIKESFLSIFVDPMLPNFLRKDVEGKKLGKNDFWALKDVSFDVNQGEILGVIGANGAGKSTLLKILSRITPPTFGSIKIKGSISSLLEVGTGFNPELSGRENIYLNGAILGMKRQYINSKFKEIVEFSGVEKFIDTPVKRYSTGMYTRLAFAVASYLNSEILIVDEVLAVGDAEFQKKSLGKMDEMTKREGRTILFVSHNLEAIKKICTRCIVLNKGVKVFDGNIEKAISKYNNIERTGELKANTGEYNPNRRGSGTLSIINIQIQDANNKKRNIFKMNETVRFRISYEIYREISGLSFRVALFSSKAKGLMLTEMFYEVKKEIVRKGEKGTFTIEVQLTSIRQGEYPLYFFIGDKEAIKQNHPLNYDVVDGLTKPLIVEAASEEEQKLLGSFSLPSKIMIR